MKTLVIISCVKEKIWKKHPEMGSVKATDAYISDYFCAQKRFAMTTGFDWIIFSAKYGFIFPDEKIENYNVTFNEPGPEPCVSNDTLLHQVKEKQLHKYSRLIVLGGKNYRNRVEKAFKNVDCEIKFPVTGQRGIRTNTNKISELTDKLLASGNIDDIL